MNKTYRQIYKEEQQLQCRLANDWGYRVRKTAMDKKSRPEGQGPTPVLKNINLRKFGKQIPKTDKILKIQQELQALQTQRILMRITEEAASRGYIQQSSPSETSPIIKMMEGKIQEYNYIIDHKHLIDRGSDETRKILKMQAKSDMEKVLQKIKGARQKLLTGDMNNQIMLNRQMAKLYRTYRQKMDSAPKSTLQYFKSKTMVPQPAKSSHSNAKKDYFLKQLDENRRKNSNDMSYRTYINNSQSDRNLFDQLEHERNNNHTEGSVRSQADEFGAESKERKFQKYESSKLKYRKNLQSFTDRTVNLGKDSLFKTLRLQNKTIDPYIQKKQALKYRQMQNKIRSNSQALQLIKNKLVNVRNNSSLSKRKEVQEQDNQFRQRAPTNYSFVPKQRPPPILIETSRKEINRAAYALVKLRQKEKEDILAGLLKRKHNKFNKIGGNRMIVKYDEHKVAKYMLEGDISKTKQKPTVDDEPNLINNNPLPMKGKVSSLHASRRMMFPHQLSYLSEQNDDQHYQRMCRNQKINLLFKKR